METRIGRTVLELAKGDITELHVDCIVNAANSELELGVGVAGAMRRKGGPQVQEECDKIIAERGRIPTGEAAITKGGKLKAKYVIHAVGPIYGEGGEDRKLRNATVNSLRLADQQGLRSIAFPAVSTGYFGLPKQRCAEVMIPAAISYLKKGSNLERVIFCLYDQETLDTFKETLRRTFS